MPGNQNMFSDEKIWFAKCEDNGSAAENSYG